MRELMHVRPAYTVGDEVFADAHRVARMAVAVGEILEVPYVDPARDAIERVENVLSDEPQLTPAEAGALARLAREVAGALDAALDGHDRPRGPGGAVLQREAARPMALDGGEPDFDRVFKVADDGRIATVYPRIPIVEIQELLPGLAAFLEGALARGVPVSVVEGA